MSAARETVTSAKLADFGTVPVVLGNGIVGQIVRFESATPQTYAHLIAGRPGEPVTLVAQLFIPDTRGAGPAVVIVPGSTGVNKSQVAHALTLTSLGLSVLLVDPFTPRHITHTYRDQTQLTTSASAYDALVAARYLLERPEVDGGRIGALGGSRGGIAVLHAAMRPLADAVLGKARGFRCVLAQYPSHLYQFRDPDIGRTEVRIAMGDSDKWTLVAPIQGYENAIRLCGGNVSMRIWRGGEHSFDRPELPVTDIPDGVATPAAPIHYMDASGVFLDPRTGEPDPAVGELDIRRDMIERFPRVGVPIGSRGGQPAEFRADMIAFFQRTLLDSPP